MRYFSEKLMEENFRRSMVLSASDPLIFVSRPPSLVLLALAAAILAGIIHEDHDARGGRFCRRHS